MNFRITALLFAFLIAVLFLFGLTLALKRHYTDPGFLLPDIATNPDLQVEKVVLTKEGEEYTFYKKGSQWLVKLPGFNEGVRVETIRMDEIIKQVRTARRSEE